MHDLSVFRFFRSWYYECAVEDSFGFGFIVVSHAYASYVKVRVGPAYVTLGHRFDSQPAHQPAHQQHHLPT